MDTLTYLVTGATGFVGNNVITKLSAEGKKVRCFARSPEKAKILKNLDNVEIYYGDTRNYDELAKMFEGEGPFAVIHTAAIVSIGDRKLERNMRDVNINGTKNIVKLCKEKNVKRLVHVSSIHAIPEKNVKGVIGEADSFDPRRVVGKYAKTKAESSAIVLSAVKLNGLNAVIVHPTGIIGPDDYSNTYLTQMILDYDAGKIPASVKGAYDFVDVRDVADGILLALEKGKAGECYLLSGGCHTITEFLDIVYKYNPKKELKLTLPMWLARFSLPFLWLYFKVRRKRPLFTGYSLYTLRSNANITHEKATSQLGYNPRSFDETIKDTVEFLKEQKFIKE